MLTNEASGLIAGGDGGQAQSNGDGGAGIQLTGLAGNGSTITNHGSIKGGDGGGLGAFGGAAIRFDVGSGIIIVNSATGTIMGGQGAAGGGSGIWVGAGATVAITNQGVISPGAGGNAFGIVVAGGTVTQLNNAQGGTTALSYSGKLPTAYNIVINSATSYGQLQVVNSGISQTTFGIDSSSVANRATLSYRAVLSGVSRAQLANTTDNRGWWGSFSQAGIGRAIWKLQAEAASPNVWDLIMQFGPDAANTRAALAANASALRSLMDRRFSDLSFSADYDCASFNKDKICLSFSARQTSYGVGNTSAGILTAAYRVNDQVRAGAFMDQGSTDKPANNITVQSSEPLYGAFVGYDQNNGTGLQAKASTSAKQSDVQITRDITFDNTEAGSGKARLNAYTLSLELGWGYEFKPNTQLIPFAGLRYSKVARGAYHESLIENSVDYPIAYNQHFSSLTTATAGVRLKGQASEGLSYQLSAGVESDVHQTHSDYAGTSTIIDLESFALPTAPVHKKTRGFATAGLSQSLARNQQLTANFSVRSQPFSGQTVSSAAVGYRLSF